MTTKAKLDVFLVHAQPINGGDIIRNKTPLWKPDLDHRTTPYMLDGDHRSTHARLHKCHACPHKYHM